MDASAKQTARRWAESLRRAEPAEWDAISERQVRRLASRHGERSLQEVEKAMQDLMSDSRPMEVTITSARPLSSGAQKELLAGLFGPRAVAASVAVDSSLIGGVVVRTADDLWDLSIRHQLERLKRSIVES